jgi:RHS repeat-associated protein
MEKTKERQLLRDEENRLLSINDNGYVSNYWYDAGGERVIKTSGENEFVYLNAAESGGGTDLSRFTAYVNPYLVVSPQGRYTKHIYIGSQRIVSKLGDLESFGQDPRRVARAGQNVDGKNGGVDYDKKYSVANDSIESRYERIFDMPFKPNDAAGNNNFCCKDNAALRGGNIGNGNDNPEKLQYYYHSDHLGSTSLITNLDGEVAQHVEYTPWGEVFIEERNNDWNTPFLFNAKELDEETGLYYYSNRYYDPRTSLFLSTDPMQEMYSHISTYAYCNNNPLKYIDPTGMNWYVKDGDTDNGDFKWFDNKNGEGNKPQTYSFDEEGNRYEFFSAGDKDGVTITPDSNSESLQEGGSQIFGTAKEQLIGQGKTNNPDNPIDWGGVPFGWDFS